MINNFWKGRNRHGLSKYLKRISQYYIHKFLTPLDYNNLLGGLKEIGVEDGDLLCVHCQFSSLGYVKGGPETFIRALIDSVGPSGTIMMPTFSMTGSMLSFIESGEMYDARSTRSKVGLVSETFRKMPGAIRSLHPTNSVAARGPLAERLVDNHEKSYTPYGDQTPYGRLPTFNGKILMINTHIQSFLHHIQEVVRFPNLYLDKPQILSGVDKNGKVYRVETLIMRPRIPYFIYLDGTEGYENDHVILHDYALIFPEYRKKLTQRFDYRLYNHNNIWGRKEELIKRGILKVKRISGAAVGLLDASDFLSFLVPEFKQLLADHMNKYNPTIIEKLNLPYF